jgi:hypothetical protein
MRKGPCFCQKGPHLLLRCFLDRDGFHAGGGDGTDNLIGGNSDRVKFDRHACGQNIEIEGEDSRFVPERGAQSHHLFGAVQPLDFVGERPACLRLRLWHG